MKVRHMSANSLVDQLFHEILMARQRVYKVRGRTPFESLDLGIDAEVFVKREDVPPINAYKWRGAYNRIATLTQEQRDKGVVAASAGNHAQGVAVAAKLLDLKATIYMPRPTPKMKLAAVAKLGGDHVTIKLVGDTYDEAAKTCYEASVAEGLYFVHPYDDIVTMGGQGTLADEIVMSGEGPFDIAFLQIGGGGMCAATACWLKAHYPNIKIVGVEGEGQASMAAAVKAGKPVELEYLDIFCDGTAVRKAGTVTHELCAELIDEFMTVSNEQVNQAIRLFWDSRRRILEPSGAIGIAAICARADDVKGKRVLTVTTGANMDFSQLGVIAANSGAAGTTRKHVRFTIGEKTGSLLGLLEDSLSEINITDFQYGKVNEETAWPVLGFDATDAEFVALHKKLDAQGAVYQDITSHEDVDYRIISYDSSLFYEPWFISLEFPERAGALRECLAMIKGVANICYFNYRYSGERVGRVLVGFEFTGAGQQEKLKALLDEHPRFASAYRPVPAETLGRILQK